VPGWAWTLLVAAAYLPALAFRHDLVPAGLNNDAAEEALRGLRLVEEGRVEVFTVDLGASTETLYLYLLGASAKLVGPTTLAAHLPSFAFALALLAVFPALPRRLDPALPAWLPPLLPATSVWLYHYARSGLRAVAAPVCLAGFAILLDRAERSPDRRLPALLAGASLGLSLYVYTSCRILPVAFAVHAGARLLSGREGRRPLAAVYGLVLAGAAVVSVPNLTYLLQHPGEYLGRGGYALVAGPADAARHMAFTFLMPVYYPESYGFVKGQAHVLDGVSAGLTSSGVSGVHPLVGIAFAAGLLAAWRRREEPLPSFLLSAWLTGSILLGFIGPSLTRLSILLPVYLGIGALGIGEARRRLPGGRRLCAAGIAVVLLTHAHGYFVTFPGTWYSQDDYFSPAQTPMGQRARALAGGGRRVVCVTGANASVLAYLTHDAPDRVRIVEFYERPLDPREIPLETFRPDVLLVEKRKTFARFIERFPPGRRRGAHPRFEEIALGEAP
jgi:hypothetical protein